MSDKLTEKDLTMIQYYWEERGNFERWCHWKSRKPLFEKEYPEFMRAVNNLEIERKNIDNFMLSIKDKGL